MKPTVAQLTRCLTAAKPLSAEGIEFTACRVLLGSGVSCSGRQAALFVWQMCAAAVPGLGALTWEDGPGFRSAALPLTTTASVGFTRMSALETRVLFTNYVAQERHLTNQILLNGSGVAAGDFDNDGWCDVYFCRLDQDNKLYRNLGDWRFEDVTERAGVGCQGVDATGAAFADLDGDGKLDLIVNSIGQGTRVFMNSGQGLFKPSLLLNPDRAGMSLALADIDGDGDLDLYIANYRAVTIRDQPNTRFSIARGDGRPAVRSVNGRPLTEPDLTNRFVFRIETDENRVSLTYDENGEPDALYRNDGNGGFTAVSFVGAFLDECGNGLNDGQFDWGLSAMFRDLNGDRAPDLYVCNDFKSPDRIWINDGKGRFRALNVLTVRQTSLSSMGVDFADINRDGHDDFIVLDMLSRQHRRRLTQRIDIQPEVSALGVTHNRLQTPRNTLFLNRGDGTYAEIAQLAGLDATEWCWTPIFLDVDLDGYEDLLVSSGFERDGMNVDVLRRIELEKKQGNLSSLDQLRLRKLFPRLPTGMMAFRNSGNLRFVEETEAWRLSEPVVSQGMAVADFDNDGDLDLAVNNMNAAARLYRNDATAPRIAVTLKGLTPNQGGIGARIQVEGGPVPQSQEMIGGGRYLSSDQSIRSFATGSSTSLTIRVTWRNGKITTVHGAAPNRIYEVREEAGTVAAAKASPARQTIFKDVSELIRHEHHEDAFDDFARQPLVPIRLSQMGPGISWFDLDGDGWEDLLVPSGRGGRTGIFRNDKGTFSPWSDGEVASQAERDQTTVLGITDGSQSRLVTGMACFEGTGPAACAREHIIGSPKPATSLVLSDSSSGPLALGDYDRDGRLDLFIGGRVKQAAYPAPASSFLFRGGTNGFELDKENSRMLENIGLVSGAVFSDLGGDATPELALACEWGPIRVFRSEQGKFQEITATLGLHKYLGWWTAVTAGDFDGDGRMDLAAANWGRNSKYERFRSQPLRLFYGDVNGDGTIETIESCFAPELKQWVPFQPYHVVMAALPFLRERFPTAESYAITAFDEIYRPVMDKLTRLEANWLESTVFLNCGERFEARVLPSEAQFAPAFGICVADANNDGKEDLFLSQNFYATSPETSRYDAGRGLWLQGSGDGQFTVLRESGIVAYGEGRGAAVCDFDHDGRVDLAIAQNGSATRLFKNVGAVAGLRVRLQGPPENPNAIGAIIRTTANGMKGPARELHAGAGYWSQDSARQVMPAGTQRLEVRWPRGGATISETPPEAKEVVVSPDGQVKIVPR
jgi:enediyne biosynthesis protein E4